MSVLKEDLLPGRTVRRRVSIVPRWSGALAAPVASGASIGAAGWIAAGLVQEPTPWRAASVAAGAACAGWAVLRQRSTDQEEQLELVQAALARLIGSDEYVQVSARRWRTDPVAGRVPVTLRIDYSPAAPSSEPTWLAKITDVVSARIGVGVDVAHHDPRRCWLTLTTRAGRAPLEAAPSPALAKRAGAVLEALFGADVRWEASWEQERLVALDVSHSMGVRISPHAVVRARIERTVATMLPGRWRAHWDLEGDTCRLELRPEFPAMLQRQALIPEADSPAWRRLPYGVDEDSAILSWDLASGAGTPHFLVVGSTGTGKTVLIRDLVIEAALRSFQIRICDPKRVEFVGLRSWPNVEIVATSVEQMVATIHQTWREMERRYQLIESGKATKSDFQPLILVLDEYRYFYGVVNAWYQGVKGPGGSRVCPILEEVFLIASLGRTADVHIILGTQRPDADWMGGDVRDQFQARASLSRLSPEGAKMMWGAHHIGVSVPRGTPGRGTSIDSAGRPVEFQAYWMPDPTEAHDGDLALLERLRPATTTYERYVVVPLDTDDEDGEPIPSKGRYEEYIEAPYEPLNAHPDLDGWAPDPTAARRAGAGAMAQGEVGQDIAAGDLDSDEDLPDYLPATSMRAGSLEGQAGHLVLVDEALDLWGVVESAERDVDGSERIVVCWRSDEDGQDYGLLVLDGDELVQVREAAEEGC